MATYVQYCQFILTIELASTIFSTSHGAPAKESKFETEIATLLHPLVPCQFILNKYKVELLPEFKKYKYTNMAMASAIVAFVTKAGGTIQVVTSIWFFSRSHYVLKHQQVCLIHLCTLPYENPRSYESFHRAHRVRDYENREYASSINWQRDMLIVFKDGTKKWWGKQYEFFSPHHCETPFTFLIIEHNEMCKITSDPSLVLLRRNPFPWRRFVEPSTSVLSARSLNMNVIGLSFQQIVSQVRGLRKNFFGTPIKLSKFGMRSIPKDTEYRPGDIKHHRDDRIVRESLAVPYLELGVKFNFTVVIMTPKRNSFATPERDRCALGELFTGTTYKPPKSFPALYNLYWQQVESIQIIYVTDVSTSSNPLQFRTIIAPFHFQLWMLTAITTAAVAFTAILLVKTRRMRVGVVYQIIFGSLLNQVPGFTKRTAKLVLLWTCTVFFLSSHFLALLQSLTISPALVEDRKSFGQLEKEGYKFWMEKTSFDIADEFYDSFKGHKEDSKFLAKDNLLLTALADDARYFLRVKSQPLRLVLKKAAALVGWTYELEVIIHEFQRLGQNVHLMDDQYLRSNIWYRIRTPNEDIIVDAFQILISTGIEEYWKRVAADTIAQAIREGVRKELGAEVGRTKDGTSSQSESKLGKKDELKLEDSLVLESFTLYGAGIIITIAVAAVKVAWSIRAGPSNATRFVFILDGHESSVEHHPSDQILMSMCEQVEGMCPNCRGAMKDGFMSALESVRGGAAT